MYLALIHHKGDKRPYPGKLQQSPSHVCDMIKAAMEKPTVIAVSMFDVPLSQDHERKHFFNPEDDTPTEAVILDIEREEGGQWPALSVAFIKLEK